MLKPKQVIGLYIHRGIVGTFNYEKGEKIIHAYTRNKELNVVTENGKYVYMDNIDLINKYSDLYI